MKVRRLQKPEEETGKNRLRTKTKKKKQRLTRLLTKPLFTEPAVSLNDHLFSNLITFPSKAELEENQSEPPGFKKPR